MTTRVKALDAYINNKLVGTFVHESPRARFVYHESWNGQSVSLSLPQGQTQANAMPYLRGLLPDNTATLTQWGNDYRVNYRNPFELLGVVGRDIPGAVQLVPTGIDLYTDKDPSFATPLSRKELHNLMEAIAHREGVWSAPSGASREVPGKFSLAGAQRKTALYRMADGRWALPHGRFPSTHIIKPEISYRFPDSDVNEAICLRAMNNLGINASNSEVVSFGSVRAGVIERYDRTVTGSVVYRHHQEDLCQALGYMPEKKYAKDGGPSASEIAAFIKQHAGDDEALEFVRQLAFTIAVGGTDSHAKNFSLIESQDMIKLAPAYDVISYLPYLTTFQQLTIKDIHSALPIGGSNRFDQVSIHNWKNLASTAGLDEGRVVDAVEYVRSHAAEAIAQSTQHFAPIARDTLVSALPDLVHDVNKRWITASVYGAQEKKHIPLTSPSHDAKEKQQGKILVRGHMRANGTWVDDYYRDPPSQ